MFCIEAPTSKRVREVLKSFFDGGLAILAHPDTHFTQKSRADPKNGRSQSPT